MDTESVAIETDEDGFHLIVKTSRTRFDFKLNGDLAEDLHDSVKEKIEPWLYERNVAFAEYTDRSIIQEPPFEITDPKHPDHHSIMSEISDSREVD